MGTIARAAKAVRIEARPGCGQLAVWALTTGFLLMCGRTPTATAQAVGGVADIIRQNNLAQGQAALPPRVDLDVDGYWSDNIRRSSIDKITDTVASVGAAVDAAENYRHLQYTARGNVNFEDYTRGSYASQAYGNFDGAATVLFMPEHFGWVFRDSFDKLAVDPTAAATPGNLATYNYFTTGPQFGLRFGAATRLIAQATYSKINVLNSGTLDTNDPLILNASLNSKRYGGLAELQHDVSANGKVALNVSTERVRYDNPNLDADYNRNDFSVAYTTRWARTTVAAELGDTRITEQGASSNGLLARLGASRRISPDSTLVFGFQRQTADSADLMRNTNGVLPSDITLQVASHDPLVDTTVSAGWRFERVRTRWGVNGYRTTERYLVNHELDRNVSGANAAFEHRLLTTVGFQVSANYFKESYTNTGVADHEIDFAVALQWYLGRKLRASFIGERFDRSGNDIHLTYKKNRVEARLSYDLLGNGFVR